MGIISYAQNFEDVMLWRALQHVGKGFYIDVGAAWPDEHSVTKAFYDAGWSGINVEPNPAFQALLQAQRSRDINLQLAVGEQAGECVMHFIEGTGLSSIDDNIAAQHASAGWAHQDQMVRMERLDTIWNQHVPPGQDVHFLKVDVEGFEEQVLRSVDWTKCRPWLVLVEATWPTSQAESHESWEPILLDNQYLFVYADGLNRFYLSSERSELRPAFKYPPNIFDRIVRVEEERTRAALTTSQNRVERMKLEFQNQIGRMQSELQNAKLEFQNQIGRMQSELQNAKLEFQNQIGRMQSELQNAKAAALVAEQRFSDITQSTSWKITRPLRVLARVLRGEGKSICKIGLKRLIHQAAQYGNKHPWFRRPTVFLLNRIPGRKQRLARVISGMGGAQAVVPPDGLSPRAQQIHSALVFAIKNTKKKEET